jgi:hypothetical protein
MVIDHVIPLAAGGSQSMDNLCLCCYRCNEFKGARLTAPDPASGEMIALFNPLTQTWREHFSWSEGDLQINGLTPVGRATVDVLHLNSVFMITARRIWNLAGFHPPLD